MPVPEETIEQIKELVEIFPELEEMIKKEEIDNINIEDLKNLENNGLTLPSITKLINKKTTPAISFEELKEEEKEIMPEDIIFIKVAKGKIDIDINLRVNSDGSLRKEVSTISGKTLSFFIKPKSKAETIKGIIVIRPREEQNLSDSSNSIFKTAFANEEPKLIVSEFEYSDIDNDGIYTTDIKIPSTEGEFDVLTQIDYQDQNLKNKDIDLTVISNPEGYVYEIFKDQELRIKNVKVSLYQLNQEASRYELFPAKEYEQNNPITTDNTGRYSFIVPKGKYYLEAQAQEYLTYRSEPFDAEEGSNINRAIELKKDGVQTEEEIDEDRDKFDVISIIKNPIYMSLFLFFLLLFILGARKLLRKSQE